MRRIARVKLKEVVINCVDEFTPGKCVCCPFKSVSTLDGCPLGFEDIDKCKVTVEELEE